MRLRSRLALLLVVLLSAAGTTGPTLRAEDPAPAAPPLRPGELDEELPEAPTAAELAPRAELPASSRPWDDPDLLFERRFVDLWTGRPLAGVTVRLFSEVPHPQPGFGSPLATVTSGPDGVARIRREQLDAALHKTYGGPHLARAEAAGYACVAEQAKLWFGEWALLPAERVGVIVLDELDRPVEGALVGWVLGCGHMPDARQARTDAQGRAWFEGVARDEHDIDPDLWIVKSGYAAELVTVVPEPDEPIRLKRARDLEGVVLADDGRPVAGAAVGVRHHKHRGPWTRTDGEGRFVLVGVSEDDDSLSLYVELEEYPIDTKGPFALRVPLPARDRPVTLRLPPGGSSRKEQEEGAGSEAPAAAILATTPVTIELRLGAEPWREGAAALGAGVVLQRRLDGRTSHVEVDAAGRASLSLPPGTYDVLARAWEQEASYGTELPCSEARGELAVEHGVEASVTLTLPVPRAVRLRLVEDDYIGALLHARGRTGRLTLSAGEDVSLLVPAEGALRLTLYDEFGRHSVELDPARQEVLELRMPRREVRARLVDASGAEVRGWLRVWGQSAALSGHPAFPGEHEAEVHAAGEAAAPANPAPSLVVRTGGPLKLLAWPESSSACWPLEVPLRAIEPGDAPLDLGTLRLPPRGLLLRVLGHDGKELESVEGAVEQEGRTIPLTDLVPAAPGEATFTGDWRAPGKLRPGAVLRVMRWSAPVEPGVHAVGMPFEARLEGPGPWEVRPPTGTLDLALAYAASEGAESATLAIDGGAPVEIFDEPLVRILGLAPGAHELLLRREKHVGRRLRLISVPDEVRRVDVHLRAR